ncbi:MAG: hypothetical protein GEU78_15315 [Actinobacteria bacterium]|nr:hypothetical protein [Actinomycetota bacterium]
MSQPRRKRRRRRRRGGGGGQQPQKSSAQLSSSGSEAPSQPGRTQEGKGGMPRRRRRRGSKGRTQREPTSPRSSEDLVRAEPRRPPTTLTIEPDGQTLEGIIGDLQSEMGIPPYPQEYRITIKVADEGGRGATIQETVQDPPEDQSDAPKREKAPAAPRIGGGIARVLTGTADEAPSGGGGGGRRRRRRRRGRGGRGRRGGSDGGSPAGGNPSS